jgi:hypothetical protein
MAARGSGFVRLGHQRRGNQEVCRGTVTGDQDVPHDAHAQQGPDVGVVGLRLQRVPEEHEHVDLALGDHCADLKVATKGAALHCGHREA